MSKLTQRQAVFMAICNVTGQTEFHSGCTLSSEQRSSVYTILSEGFVQGKIELADTPSNQQKLNNDSEMRKYVSGLVNNWLRKDVNLNGGVKYAAKNPGSRAGSQDEQIKTLKALKTQFSAAGDTERAAVIEEHIAKRISEIASEKAKARVATIDLNTLSEETRKLLGL